MSSIERGNCAVIMKRHIGEFSLSKLKTFYDNLEFLVFTEKKKSHQEWFIYPISGMIMAIQTNVLQIELVLPSQPSAMRTFFKALFDSKPQDVVDATPILEKLGRLQGCQDFASVKHWVLKPHLGLDQSQYLDNIIS